MRAGAGQAIITPPLPVQLAGHKGPRSAIGVHDELRARAVVMHDGDRLAALVSVELLWLGREHCRVIRSFVQDTTGIPCRNVFIACSHTHSGPDTLDWYDFAPPICLDWLRQLCRQIASAVYQAYKALEPARLKMAASKVEIGINRRLKTEHGIERHPNPHGPVDHRVHTVSVVRANGTFIANIMHQGTHPVILGAGSDLVSGDWPGAACRTVEQALGGICLFLNGACGDVNPSLWTNGTTDDMKRIGTRVGSAVVEAALRDGPLDSPSINIVSEDIVTDSYEHPYLKTYQRERLSRDGGMHVEVQALRIGSVTLVSAPGECLVETSQKIELGVPNVQILVVSYANDYLGYLPLAHIIDEGGYEARTRMLNTSGINTYVETAIRLAASVGR